MTNTNKDIEIAREEMIEAIDAMPAEEKAAFDEAFEKAPQLVEKESNLDLFLRVEDCDAHAAALRLARHWNVRKEIFGDDAFRPMDLSPEGPLSEGDLEIMERAVYAQLPHDSSGRPVIYIDPSRLDEQTVSTAEAKRHRFPILFYTLHKIAMENPRAQTDGIVVIRHFDASHVQFKQVIHVIQDCMPLKIHKFHFCCSPSSSQEKKYIMSRVAPMLVEAVGKDSRNRVALHLGKPKSLLKSLCKYGLSQEGLPARLGGSWSYDEYVNMVRSMKAKYSVGSCETEQRQEFLREMEKKRHRSAACHPKKRMMQQQEMEKKQSDLEESKKRASESHDMDKKPKAARLGSGPNEERDRKKKQHLKKLERENKKLKAMLENLKAEAKIKTAATATQPWEDQKMPAQNLQKPSVELGNGGPSSVDPLNSLALLAQNSQQNGPLPENHFGQSSNPAELLSALSALSQPPVQPGAVLDMMRQGQTPMAPAPPMQHTGMTELDSILALLQQQQQNPSQLGLQGAYGQAPQPVQQHQGSAQFPCWPSASGHSGAGAFLSPGAPQNTFNVGQGVAGLPASGSPFSNQFAGMLSSPPTLAMAQQQQQQSNQWLQGTNSVAGLHHSTAHSIAPPSQGSLKQPPDMIERLAKDLDEEWAMYLPKPKHG